MQKQKGKAIKDNGINSIKLKDVNDAINQGMAIVDKLDKLYKITNALKKNGCYAEKEMNVVIKKMQSMKIFEASDIIDAEIQALQRYNNVRRNLTKMLLKKLNHALDITEQYIKENGGGNDGNMS